MPYFFVSYDHARDGRIYRAVKCTARPDDVVVLLGSRQELEGGGCGTAPLELRYAEEALSAGFSRDGFMYRIMNYDTTRHTQEEYVNQPHLTEAERDLTPGLFGPRGLIA